MSKTASFAYRLDERVLSAMIVLIVISLLVLSFRFKNAEPCSDVYIDMRAANYYEGSLISFSARTTGGRTYEWDFNDGSRSDISLASITHVFDHPGTYIVSVVVNGHCEGFDTLVIREAPVIKRISMQSDFIGPDTAIVNKPVLFTDTSNDATSWEWRFGESNIVDDRSQRVSYTYKTPGPKTIYLKINGRSDRFSTRTIYVKDVEPLVRLDNTGIKPMKRAVVNNNPKIPDAPKGTGLGKNPVEGNIIGQPDKPKPYPDVQADEMIILIEGLVSGEKKAADFTQYFCDGVDIPVTYNGKPMKFSQVCNILKDFKKISNISKPEVQLMKNASTNCIRMMIINVTKRSRFEKLFGKKK